MDESSKTKIQMIFSGINLLLVISFALILSFETSRVDKKNAQLAQHKLSIQTSLCNIASVEAAGGDLSKLDALRKCKNDLREFDGALGSGNLKETNASAVLSQSKEKVEYALLFLEELKKTSPDKGRNLVFLSGVINKPAHTLRADSPLVRKFGLFLLCSLCVFAIFLRDKKNKGFYSTLWNSVKFKGES